MGNTRPGAVRHSSRQAAHRAQASRRLSPRARPLRSRTTAPARPPSPTGTPRPPRTRGARSPRPAATKSRAKLLPSEACEREKKIAEAKPMAMEGVWEGGWHWAYLRLTADEEDPEKFEEIRRKMSS